MKRLISFCGLVLLVVTLMGATSLAFADESGDSGSAKREALDNASLLLGFMMSNPDYGIDYGIECIDAGSLVLYEAVPVFAESDEGDRELLVDCAVWPIADANGQVAVMVQFVDADGDSVFKLTSSLNERFGEQLLRPGVSLVVHGDSVELETDVESAVVRNRSMHQDETGLMEAIIVADIVEKNALSSSEVLVGSPYPRTSSQPQIGIVRVKQFGSLYGWAACVSSIGEYMTGVKRADIAISQQVLGSGTPANAGAMEVSAGLRLYYYPSSNTVLNGKAMTGSIGDTEIKRWIDGGLPVYAVFGDPPLLTGLEHAVVGGYAYDSAGRMCLVGMDPATGLYVNYSKGSGGTYGTEAGRTWTLARTCLTGWQKPWGGSKWVWMRDDGTREKGWFSPNGDSSYYWFDSSGYMVTNNWVSNNGKWYHLGASGAMDTGWFKSSSSGYWYYLGDDGAARTGWNSIGGYWYVFDSGGAMYRGWYQDGSTWYYLRTASNVPSGGPEGSMLCNGTWTINGKAYRFDSSGACLNP